MRRGGWVAVAIVLVSIAAIVRMGMRNQAGGSGDGLWLEVGRELSVVTDDEDNSGQMLRFVLPTDSSRARRVVMPAVRFEDIGMATPAADSGDCRWRGPRASYWRWTARSSRPGSQPAG